MRDAHVHSGARLVRWMALFAIFSCGDDSATPTDAAVTHSHDASSDARSNGIEGGGDDGLEGGGDDCAPADVTTFTPPTYKHARQPEQVCSAAFINSFYADCLETNATVMTCAPWGTTGDAAHQACAACIITPDTASQYGAIVEAKGTVYLNVAGCMELEDPANGASCAAAYQTSEECNEAACATTCPVTDDASYQLYEACVQQAAANGCETFSMAAACANDEADGGAAAVCFAGSSFRDFYDSVVPIFCGGGVVGDAGSDATRNDAPAD